MSSFQESAVELHMPTPDDTRSAGGAGRVAPTSRKSSRLSGDLCLMIRFSIGVAVMMQS